MYPPTPAVSRASASEKPTRTRIPANTKTKQQHETMVRRHFPSQLFNVRPRNKKPKLKKKGHCKIHAIKKKTKHLKPPNCFHQAAKGKMCN